MLNIVLLQITYVYKYLHTPAFEPLFGCMFDMLLRTLKDNEICGCLYLKMGVFLKYFIEYHH